MPRPTIRVDLFCEDNKHQTFCAALVQRLSRDANLKIRIKPLSVQGGHGKAITELKDYSRALSKGNVLEGAPDLLVVVIDANCKGLHDMQKEIKENIDSAIFPHSVVGTPDPHIERWYLDDQETLKSQFDKSISPPKYKCERDRYKKMLDKLINDAGFPSIQGGAEFGPDIARSINLQTRDASLKCFIDDLQAAIKLIQID